MTESVNFSGILEKCAGQLLPTALTGGDALINYVDLGSVVRRVGQVGCADNHVS